MTYVRVFRSGVGGRIGAVVAGTVLLVLIGVFLTFGFVLLLALAAAGLVLGIGGALLRRLTGRAPVRRDELGSRGDLDPAMEVKPPLPPHKP